jgi:hypothetical protein
MKTNGQLIKKTEVVAIGSLKPHPRNYRGHPDDQLSHITESIRTNGIYRNIVVARDGTILAGHGVVEAAKKMGLKEVPVIRIDVDPEDTKALKIMTGDNEISHLAELDDRTLTELLKDINLRDPEKLLGTGFDEQMLAALALVTRPKSELNDINEAAEWVGMPGYNPDLAPLKIVVSFMTEEDRQSFAALCGATFTPKTKSMWWPLRDKDDVADVRFEAEQ